MENKEENKTSSKKSKSKVQVKKHKIKNEEGETLKQQEEIKNEYNKYYKTHLKTKHIQ